MQTYIVVTENGLRAYQADDEEHAEEQHADAFPDEEPLLIHPRIGAPRKITLTVEFVVEETSDTEFGRAEWLVGALEEYVTRDESPLREDYGPGAWGGYDGPYITHARVVESSVTPRSSLDPAGPPRMGWWE